MTTQTNNTITKQDFDNAINNIRHDMKVWLGVGIGIFVALLIGLGVLVWEVAKDTNQLQAEVDILQQQHAVQHP